MIMIMHMHDMDPRIRGLESGFSPAAAAESDAIAKLLRSTIVYAIGLIATFKLTLQLRLMS